MKKPQRVYLASPYTHADPEVMEKRYKSAVVATKALLLQGYAAFSPIVHSHRLLQDDILPTSNPHEFWMDADLPWLESADVVVVLVMPGWTQSRGVDTEVKLAQSLRIPVKTFAEFLREGL